MSYKLYFPQGNFQTLNNKSLKFINRNHNRATSIKAIKLISNYFHNYSVDLIYGIPNSSLHEFKYDINEILKFKPKHISAYNMTIEKNTVFSKWLEKGIIEIQNENATIKQFNYLKKILKKQKYIHYEISNFCQKNYASKHNLGYWKRKKYLGIGPSAHSFNGKTRSWNVSNNLKYISSINKKIFSNSTETLTKKMIINEIIMTGIRNKWGIDNNYLISSFKYDILKKQKSIIAELMKEKLIRLNKSQIIATNKGLLLSNNISEQLFV